jgi:hydrogenase large subunit
VAKTITVGPVTRIEGHLDVEVTLDVVDGSQRVVDARSAGTMFRGFERILQRRHPRDAVHLTTRICGVCPTSHSMAASMNLEAACGAVAAPPDNGRILRNLILGADFLQSHILHFYHLALLDYVDGSGLVAASPGMPAPAGPDFVSGADAGPLLRHYVEAMEARRKTHQLGAVFGGKMPCSPVFVPGGCTHAFAETGSIETRASQRVALFRRLLDEVRAFIAAAYLPDVEFLAKRFAQYAAIGRGCGNLVAFGAFDLDASGSKRLFERGVWTGGQKGPLDPKNITEDVKYSRYAATASPLHPSAGVTQPEADKPGAYSWIKAPRYSGQVCEVGPLARLWISGFYRQGISVMDRLLARAHEARRLADAMAEWVQQLRAGASSRRNFAFPSSGSGVGLTEAPRGALGHWIEFSGNAIERYQVLTPTAWNASPMDERGGKGPIEQALLGTPVRDKDQPVELLRVVHSFDPCLACSVH